MDPQGLIAHQGVGVGQAGRREPGAGRVSDRPWRSCGHGHQREPPHLSVGIDGGRGQCGFVGLLRRRERRQRQAANPDRVLRIVTTPRREAGEGQLRQRRTVSGDGANDLALRRSSDSNPRATPNCSVRLAPDGASNGNATVSSATSADLAAWAVA